MNEEIKKICKEAAGALLQALRLGGMPDGYRPEIYFKLMKIANDKIPNETTDKFCKFIIEKKDGIKIRFFIHFNEVPKVIEQINAFHISFLCFETYYDKKTKYRTVFDKRDIKNYEIQISNPSEDMK